MRGFYFAVDLKMVPGTVMSAVLAQKRSVFDLTNEVSTEAVERGAFARLKFSPRNA